MNRKERRAWQREQRCGKDQDAFALAFAGEFNKARATGEDTFVVAFMNDGLTVAWTGPEGAANAGELASFVAGRTLETEGKAMIAVKADTPDAAARLQILRDSQEGRC